MEKRDFEGTNIGNYRIKSIIGRGAFSDVYLASHVILTERVVAIKLLHSHLSEREYEHFLQEARLLERLRHPNILPILDAGIFESSAYLITEYAPGGSLRDLLKYTARERLPIEDTLKILTQIGDALEYAHEHKVIHRDVKPENILFNSERDVLLADFGIAVVQAQETTGEVIGTPSYMAPEQFEGKVSRKSDQYALGCIAYELLTGQRPFTGPSMQSIMARHLFEMPPPLHQLVRSIPIAIEQIVLKSLAKDPKGRFNSVSEFISTLQGATQSLTSVPETSSETSGPPTSTPDTSSETPTSRTSIPETSETPAAQPPQPPSSTILLPTPRRSPDDLKDFFIMSHNTDRYHDCGHGDYFSPEFVKKFWVPFIKDGQFIRSEWDITRPTQS